MHGRKGGIISISDSRGDAEGLVDGQIKWIRNCYDNSHSKHAERYR